MNHINIFENFNEIDKFILSYPNSILYMNIRSLRLNFSPLLASIHNIVNNIDFIILSKTNITNDENNLFMLNGFNSHFLNRDGRGGGVALYVRDSISHTNTHIKTKSFEAIQIDVCNNNKIFSLIAVYRPPKNSIAEFIRELDEAINKIKNKQNIIIVGDMNVDILTQNITTTKYKEMLSSNGMECVINESTRDDIKKRSSTCIDHIHVRNTSTTAQRYASIVRTSISDHYALFFCQYETKEKLNKQTHGVEYKKNHNININNYKVNKLISETKWSEIQNLDSNNIFNQIYEKFNKIYQYAETKNNKNIKKNRKKSPWLNEYLLNCCDIRDKLYNKWLNNKNNVNYEMVYKKFRNSLNKKLTY